MVTQFFSILVTMPLSVLIFGHSFVSRFKKHLFTIHNIPPSTNTDSYNCSQLLQVDRTTPTVHIKGIPGLKVLDAANPFGPLFSLVIENSPDIVILDLGTIDLDTTEPQHHGQQLVTHLQNLADALVNVYGVRRVVFLHIIMRGTHNLPHSKSPVHTINITAFSVNLALKQFAKTSPVSFCHWSMKGLNKDEALDSDGLHLNDSGLYHYYYNIRKIITSSCKLLQ